MSQYKDATLAFHLSVLDVGRPLSHELMEGSGISVSSTLSVPTAFGAATRAG